MEGVCEQTPPQPPGGPTTTQGRWGERQAEKRLLEAAEGLGTVLQCRLHCRQAQWRPHTSWSHLREPRPLHDVCSLDTGRVLLFFLEYVFLKGFHLQDHRDVSLTFSQ